MNPYMNEDIMWQRLKDIQLEAENRRLYGPRNLPALVALAGVLGRRVRWLAGLATRRAPRRRPLQGVEPDCDDAAGVAYPASSLRRATCAASGPPPAPGTSRLKGSSASAGSRSRARTPASPI